MCFQSEVKWVGVMIIGARSHKLRQEKSMSQGDVEKAIGLLRCYTSRVENGHTFTSIETLEKYAAAFHVPLHRLFCDGDEPPPLPKSTPRQDLEELAKKSANKGSEARLFLKLLVGDWQAAER